MGDNMIRLRQPVAPDSVIGRLAQDGQLSKSDILAIARQTGPDRSVAPGLVTNDLSRADLAAAGIQDRADQDAVFAAYRDAVKDVIDPVSWQGFDPIGISLKVKARPAQPSQRLPEVVVTAKRPATTKPAAEPSALQRSYAVLAQVLTPAERQTLQQLLNTGKLAQRDRHGTMLVEHLARLVQHPLITPSAQDETRIAADLAPARANAKAALDGWHKTNRKPYSPDQQQALRVLEVDLARVSVAAFHLKPAQYQHDVAMTLIRHLADVNQVQQGGYGTCAPTIAQIHLLMTHPADYARTVADLFTAGKTTLLDGHVVPLQRAGLVHVGNDNTDTSAARDWINMAFQSSLADDVTPGTYSKVDENMQRSTELASLGLKTPGRGLGTNERTTLHEGMSGEDYQFVSLETPAKSGRNDAGLATLHRELYGQTGSPPFVPIRFNYGTPAKPESHAMAAVGQSTTHVYIRNPQGNNFGFYQRRNMAVQTESATSGSPQAGKHYIELDAKAAATWNKPVGLRVYEDGTEAVPWTTAKSHLWGVYTRE
jgi:hypothetical protein